MNALLDFFAPLGVVPVAAWLLALNIGIVALCVGGGALLTRAFRHRPAAPPPPPLERQEIVLASICVVLNTAVSVAGWALWRAGVIVIRTDLGVRAALDALLLLVVMDAAMYVLHRAAHIPILYRLVHATHHRYDRPRPLDLFVLSPLEVVGFGGLWLLVLAVCSPAWIGVVAYLGLNAVFGAVGHLGVEPLPDAILRAPLLRHLGTSTFHADHHQDPAHNFGFYTDVWDRLFRTRKPGRSVSLGETPKPPAQPAQSPIVPR
jgi:sterol desaturase/sphingolipid hydroxylase (fatty acid hydroxylase superfamily)